MTKSHFLAAVPALPVSDAQRAVEFYVQALGFTELTGEDGAGLGILRRDEVELHLWVAEGSAKGAEAYLAGSASCRIEVSDVDAVHAHCQALGVVHPKGPLREQPWGQRDFSVLDPDGNLVGLFQRLG